MKKTIITAIMAGVMVFAMAGSVFAAEKVTAEDARKTALDAAGLKEEQVIFKTAGKTMDDGMEIFEMDFFVPGEAKYEFDIDASTGRIIDQDKELWEAEDDFEYALLIKEHNDRAAAPSKKETAPKGELTEAQAKEAALKDAGLSAGEVTFTKCFRDMDDGVVKFEIEFLTADGMEHDYEIGAADGRILERSAEAMDMDD